MKILIVDNDKDIIEVIKKAILSKTAYDVDVAYNGEEAIESLNKNKMYEPYDLLITDIMMPGVSGLDICEKMIADEKLKNIPVILASSLPVSSIEFQEALTRAHKLKVVKDVLQKPFEIDTLINKIDDVFCPKRLIIEKPKTKVAWLAMGFGLGAILGGPVAVGRLNGENIGTIVRISFEVTTLILSISSIVLSLRAYKKGEKSFVLLVGFVSAILVIAFWIIMNVGGFLFL